MQNGLQEDKEMPAHMGHRPSATKCLHDLRGAVAAWVLGFLQTDDLPQLAATALGEGLDNAALRQLSGVTSADIDVGNELLRRGLEESGWSVPDERTAAVQYAVCVSRLILSEDLTPYQGARAIWQASLSVGDRSFHDLDPFIYAAAEWEERPQDRRHFEQAVVEEARTWAERN
jgi:hypothetical protein